jgi:hypothetical protein
MDDKIYLGQDFPITLKINENLAGATDLKLNREDPQGEAASQLNLTIINEEEGETFFMSTDNEFNMIGPWNVWPTYTNGDGLSRIGKPSQIYIHKPGT